MEKKATFVELFAGSKTMSQAFEKAGFSTVSIDIEPKHEPDICIDICNLRRSLLPGHVDVIWASPPCTAFSLLQSHNHFKSWPIGFRRYYHEPRTPEAASALTVLRATARVICQMNPVYYFIENPRAILRHRPEMVFVPYRKTVRYSDFGCEYEKPTDIWTNCPHFQPYTSTRPVGLKKVTDLPNAHERAKIPEKLAEYVANICAKHLTRSVLLTPTLF
ncbi:DNA methyltransferase [Inoviridae sp.]|nr:DNA methyltransferase [Inoviridae sp.]UOF78995.1 DNA methyltransferase [Inoviridae sp.]UOF81649.1 DNA methyltransferase [Inoviridae sp.]